MNRFTRTTLAVLAGVAVLLGSAAPATAAEYNDQAPGTSKSSLTEYVSFKEAPVHTAVAPSGYLRTSEPYIIENLTVGDDGVRYFQASEPFTGPDRTEWRAVNRYWESENGDYEAMFVPEESIAEVLTREEYSAKLAAKESSFEQERLEREKNFQGSGSLFGNAPYYATDDTAAGPAGTVGYPTPVMSMSNPYEANGETWQIASSREFGEDLYYVLASDVEEYTPYAVEATASPSASATFTAGNGPQAPPVEATQDAAEEQSSLPMILGILAGVLVAGAIAVWAVIVRRKKQSAAEAPGSVSEIPDEK